MLALGKKNRPHSLRHVKSSEQGCEVMGDPTSANKVPYFHTALLGLYCTLTYLCLVFFHNKYCYYQEIFVKYNICVCVCDLMIFFQKIVKSVEYTMEKNKIQNFLIFLFRKMTKFVRKRNSSYYYMCDEISQTRAYYHSRNVFLVENKVHSCYSSILQE